MRYIHLPLRFLIIAANGHDKKKKKFWPLFPRGCSSADEMNYYTFTNEGKTNVSQKTPQSLFLFFFPLQICASSVSSVQRCYQSA